MNQLINKFHQKDLKQLKSVINHVNGDIYFYIGKDYYGRLRKNTFFIKASVVKYLMTAFYVNQTELEKQLFEIMTPIIKLHTQSPFNKIESENVTYIGLPNEIKN